MMSAPTYPRERVGAGIDTSIKINRLVAACHLRGCAAESNAALADSVGRVLGRPVREADIAGLRVAPARVVDIELLTALAQHFGVPIAYLVGGDSAYERVLDRTLRLLASARDLGPGVCRL